MRLINYVISVLVLVGCTVSTAVHPYIPALKISPDRAVNIEGVITTNHLAQVSILVNLMTEQSKPIYIYITSNGGNTKIADYIISAIDFAKKNDVTVICIGKTAVMSAAFNIFMACSERYVTADTLLMFHESRYRLPAETVLLRKDLVRYSKEIENDYNILVDKLVNIVGISIEPAKEAIEKAYLWTSFELMNASKPGFMKILIETKEDNHAIQN